MRRLMGGVRRLLPLAALVLVVAPAAQATVVPQRIYVINESTEIGNETIASIVSANQAAVTEDFAPHWKTDAELVLADPGSVPAGAWRLTLEDAIACWFCVGYHDVDEDGTPFAEVLVDATDPIETQVTLSHELFEILVNPYIDRAVMGPRRFWALETADPVEATEFAYRRGGVAISDFVLPAWFRKGAKGPWDFTGHTRKPRQLLGGGYQLYYANGAWHAIYKGDDGRAEGHAKAWRWTDRRH
jgi:hypothetical protein